MKIIHIGGYHSITTTLAKYQARFGHDVSVLDTPGQEYAFEMPFECISQNQLAKELSQSQADVVQFHRCESIAAVMETDRELLSKLKGRAFLYSYGNESASLIALHDHLGLSAGFLRDSFVHVFWGTADSGELLDTLGSWSWLALPIDLALHQSGEAYEPRMSGIRVVHIPYRSARHDTATIERALREIQGADSRLAFEIVPPEKISSRDELHSLLRSCDIYLEHLSQSSFGILALEAMGLGRSVLSGNSSASHNEWAQLSTCPVIDVNADSLARRLGLILREPRCLKDIAKRSRQYVEQHHNAEIISRLMLDYYAKKCT